MELVMKAAVQHAVKRPGRQPALWVALFVVCASGCAATPSATPSASKDLHRLLAEAWEFALNESPLFATRVGDHRANDRLDSHTPESIERRAAANRRFLSRLEAIRRDSLPAADRVSYDIFKRLKTDQLAEHKFRTYLMPITNRSGFHVYFPELPEQVPLNTLRDYENYVARLRAFRQYAAEHIHLMRQGIEAGLVLPRVVLTGYEASLTPHIVDDPTKSLLFAPFEKFPRTIEDRERRRLTNAGRSAIATSVVPGYRRFLKFMSEEYVPAARSTIAAAALPNGKAFYEYRVRHFTTLDDLTPRSVHETGLAEVNRIRAEMQKVISDSGFEGDFAAFLKFLRTEPRFYAETPQELLGHVGHILKRMDGEMPSLFKTLPRMPYGLEQIPDYIAPKTTSAYYQQPSGDGTRAGTYFLNTYNLKSRPLYEMEALSLHEAVPGHHHQLALQQEIEDLPEFRRFSSFTAFVEGWALYAERLGLEAGFYTDPYSNFGRLTYEMWRACRLVVDTGMHYFGWTRQKAIDFMAENTALTLLNITNEIDRYISWPGQALSYKVGELKIRELRALAENTLGADFDLREFHDVVLLNGGVPLTVLEGHVERWLSERGGG